MHMHMYLYMFIYTDISQTKLSFFTQWELNSLIKVSKKLATVVKGEPKAPSLTTNSLLI